MLITPSYIQVNPNFTEPGIILPYSQASGAFETLADSQPLARLSEGDLYVYMNRLQVQTKVMSGQAAANQLPSISISLSQISTPTYLLRVRGEYDHHDTAAANRWGVPIVEAQRLGMRQGHFQLARNALLYGINPAGGEGLVNANGATALPLPPDTNGNDTVQTYDNGQMGQFLLGQISALKTRTNQLGLPHKIVILGPQRILGQWEYQDIVQVTSFQREGAGSVPVAGMVKEVAAMNGDNLIWVYDDTLLGKGDAGSDLVIIVMPEVTKPMANGINTNELARLQPGINACSLMYCDMAAPREIPSPLAGGAIDVLSEWRITSGWAVRPEAVTLVSMVYE